MIAPAVQDQLPEIVNILSKYNIKRAYLFGSACSGEFKDGSDVDFLVSFKAGLDPVEQGEEWWDLLFELEDYLQREVDLLTENSLKNRYFIESVNQKKQLIYEA